MSPLSFLRFFASSSASVSRQIALPTPRQRLRHPRFHGIRERLRTRMFPFAPPHTRWTAPPTARCWESHVPPVALFHQFNGIEEELFDDFRHTLTQGEHTYLCFMHAFDISKADAILRAASALEWTLRLIVLSDAVLQGMNWDKSRDRRFDARVRTDAERLKEYHARRAGDKERPPAD